MEYTNSVVKSSFAHMHIASSLFRKQRELDFLKEGPSLLIAYLAQCLLLALIKQHGDPDASERLAIILQR